MKNLKKILVILIIAALLISAMAACNNGSDKDGKTKGDAVQEKTDSKKDNKLDDANIKVFLGYKPSETMLEDAKVFEETYKGKVTWVTSPWETSQIKLMTLISTGESPDLVGTWYQDMPKYAIKKVLQPVNSYIDLENPLFSKDAMELSFKWGKEYYAMAGKQANPIVIIFNKTMFLNNGLKTPLEYYEEGQWNWDNFRNVCIELTQDNDNDGKTDIYGYASWIDELFQLSNGGVDLVVYEADGSVKLNTNDSRFIQAAQFYQDLYVKDKAVHPDHWGWYEAFAGGKAAMIAERSYIGQRLEEQKFKDEWDIAPFPAGPASSANLNSSAFSGWGIATGAKNPKGAVKMAEIFFEQGEERDRNNENEMTKYLTDKQINLLNEMSKSVTASKFNGYSNMWRVANNFWDEVRNGSPVGTTIAKYDPVFQAEIDATIADDKMPEIEKFVPISTVDFESGDLGVFTDVSEDNGKSVKLTSDASEIVGGKYSLKISTQEENSLRGIVKTDETKFKLPPLNSYKVTFDFKVITPPVGEEGRIFVQIRPKSSVRSAMKTFGWGAIDATNKDSGKFEGTFVIDDPNSRDNCLVIGSQDGGEIVIDNISIMVVEE